MQNKAIFLDRDGTINVDKGYICNIEDLEFLPNSIEGLRLLKQIGYNLIVVTNQSGIGRGYFTEKDYLKFKDEMHRQLEKKGVSITAEYFCSHKPEENCNCRKPKTGMLEQAARDFNLIFRKCWMIGDSISDIQTGKRIGCKTIHVLTGQTKDMIYFADFEAINLIEAANYILNHNKNK